MEYILKEMLSKYQAGNKSCRPDVISYTTVMQSWAKKGHPVRAQEILRMMFEDYQNSNESAKPDRQAFNTVLAAFSRSKAQDSAELAERFIMEMRQIAKEGILDVHPDVFSVSNGRYR